MTESSYPNDRNLRHHDRVESQTIAGFVAKCITGAAASVTQRVTTLPHESRDHAEKLHTIIILCEFPKGIRDTFSTGYKQHQPDYAGDNRRHRQADGNEFDALERLGHGLRRRPGGGIPFESDQSANHRGRDQEDAN